MLEFWGARTLGEASVVVLSPKSINPEGVPVQAALAHAVEALMGEENYRVPGLQPAAGRLANALVAVLGPELTLGSRAYARCRTLIREMQV